MNAERLLAHYEKIADAPDAINRLRRFIIDLAVRGKLVPQDASDEPASELLKRIEKEKTRLMEAKDVKREDSPIDVDQGKLLFVPPPQWLWTRLATISRRIHYGYTASADAALKDVRMLRITDIQDNAVDWDAVPGCVIDAELVDQYRLERGDILIARTGGTIGKTFLVGDVPLAAVFASYLIRVQGTPNVFDQFLKIFLESSLYWTQLYDGARGTGQPNVNGQTLGKLILPLPPLAEQRRIVAKVEELMGLCDRLEAARTGREGARDRLAAASLARLNAPDPETFEADARFALDALPALTTRPDQIKALRQTILNLAVRGKLVPQDPSDEPASELLGRFANAKAKERKGRDWSKSENGNREQGFVPPMGWEWTTIDATAHRVTVGYVGPMKDQYVDEGIPFLRSQNVRANSYRPDGLTFITREFHHKIIKSALAPGDVVVVRSGNVGTACAIPADLPVANCSDLVVIQKPECIVAEFLCFYLNSLASIHVEAGMVGVALTHFNTKSVANMPIPLPPLAEQHRIVAKVDTLTTLCDRLEASLAATALTRRRLLDALLAEALAPVDAGELEAAE